jgi:hypothetical protein
MEIKKANIKWKYALTPLDLSKVDAIALHHMAHPTAGIAEIDKWHKDKGWAGFAYNYWIGFDGQIWEGRGFNQGAGVTSQNSHIISIGFQGNYEPFKDVRGNMVQYETEMPKLQFDAGVWLIRHLLKLLPSIKVVEGHKYFEQTSCPGKYFPLEQMKGESVLTWEQKNKEFVKRFQTATGLTADGLAGNDTNNMFDSVESILRDFTGQKGNYPQIELKTKDGIKFVEIDPLKMEYEDLSKNPKKVRDIAHKNFANGPLFFPGGRPIWFVAQKGKVLYQPMTYDYRLQPKGMLIIYMNGLVEVKTCYSIVNVSNVHLAFHGFNLNYEANGGKNMLDSIAREDYGGDVYRKCNRVGFGYNGKKAIIANINGTAEDLRKAMRQLGCIDKNNDTCGIGVDAGSRNAFVVNGTIVSDGGNYQEHIITF